MIRPEVQRFLEKHATPATQAASATWNIAKMMLLGAGVGTGAMLGAQGIGTAIRAAHEKATRKSNLQDMLNTNPDLKKEPRKDVEAFFGVLRDYAPELTKNPHVAGAFVRQAVYTKEVGTSPAAIKQLVDIASTLRAAPRDPAALPMALQHAIYQGGLTGGTAALEYEAKFP